MATVLFTGKNATSLKPQKRKVEEVTEDEEIRQQSIDPTTQEPPMSKPDQTVIGPAGPITPIPNLGPAPMTNQPGDFAAANPGAATIRPGVRFNPDGTSTVTTKTGKVFIFNKQQYNAFLAAQGSETAARNTQFMGGPDRTTLEAINEQRTAAQTASQQDIQEILQAIQPGQINIGEDTGLTQGILAAGLTEGLQKGLAGAGTGAVAGLAGGPAGAGAGAAALGAGGFVLGFGQGVYQRLKQNADQKIVQELTPQEAIKNLQSITNQAHMGVSRLETEELYRKEVQRIYETQARLKRLTDNDVQDFLGDPGDELADINDLIDVRLQQYNLAFADAVVNPNPTKMVLIDSEPNGS